MNEEAPNASNGDRRTAHGGERRRRGLRVMGWFGLGGGLVLIFVVVLSLIRFPDSNPPALARRDKVGMSVGLSQTMKAEVDLFDPTPLFLPTINNAGFAIRPRTLQMASQGNLSSYPPKLFNLPERIELHFPEVINLPKSPPDGLHVGREPNPYRAIGQEDRNFAPLSDRLGYLEIVPAGGGVPLAMILSKRPGAPEGDWRPMEWMAIIDRKGLMGSLALVISSGEDECDGYFRNYLTERLRMGIGLRPGTYRLRLGP